MSSESDGLSVTKGNRSRIEIIEIKSAFSSTLWNVNDFLAPSSRQNDAPTFVEDGGARAPR